MGTTEVWWKTCRKKVWRAVGAGALPGVWCIWAVHAHLQAKTSMTCLRTYGGNTHAIKKQIQLQFRKNAGEADPDKIIEQKEAAVRGLSNYMFVEAQRMAQEGKGADKFDG
eukprot:jgi/Astpho2/1168/Aster-x0987